MGFTDDKWLPELMSLQNTTKNNMQKRVKVEKHWPGYLFLDLTHNVERTGAGAKF